MATRKLNLKPTYQRQTVIFFDNKDSRQQALDFLNRLGIPFTYNLKVPLIRVAPKTYIKKHLDLYLTGIIRVNSEFKYRKGLIPAKT